MQLTPSRPPSPLRRRLGAVACVLLTAGTPAASKAGAPPSWQLDASGLLYGERQRTSVLEPTARITRLFRNRQALSGAFTLDAISGASPSGAMPSGQMQTTTSPSGNVTTTAADQIPTSHFQDLRGALDLEWTAPVARYFTVMLGTHVSREKDYRSGGASGQLSVEFWRRLFTFSVGGGENRDEIFPVGGTPVGLSDGVDRTGTGSNDKRVSTRTVGLSRILTRRWLVGVHGSATSESGYLTEPYKVISLIDPVTGFTTGQLTELRPGSRERRDVLGSSVYHFQKDVLYLSYRYYWDDWGVTSHTIDARWRIEGGNGNFLQPHARLYTQTAADFHRFGLVEGEPLPAHASSDQRLGPLHDATVGATYGFALPGASGQWTVRAELIVQWGDGHPADAVGVQREMDLFPAVPIGTLLVGYSVAF